jgi:hypothetical protein
MKIGAREIAFLAVGFVIGAVLAALLTTTALWLVRNSAKQSTNQADTTTQRCFDTLLAATAANDYDQFVSMADDTFRRSITRIAFQSISQSLAPRMQRGCTPTYLGQLQQNGAQVSLWRLTFADGGDDRLARMSLSQDRVDGFLITPAF